MAQIYCSNTRCQAPNPQSNKFCQQCRTPLLRRYLWAIGEGIETYPQGEVLAERYLVVGPRILLDTKPGLPPDAPPDIPVGIAPYLRLSPHKLHLPQPYGWLTLTEGRSLREIWLLEDAPIGETKTNEAEGQLFPELTSIWQDASGFRQLNWLWQMASLWEPLSSEGVASSLLTPALLRTEGSLVRLLELQPDAGRAPTLQHLGELWSQWMPGTSAVIAGFFTQLTSQLTEGKLQRSEELVALLDKALQDTGRSLEHRYQIFTSTDKGPNRNQNEDACYPPPGQLIRPAKGEVALAIVCDGIGGHAGGEVASNLAIDTLRERVANLPAKPDECNPAILTEELERAACAANDQISQQNDSENRSDRQRMGTTLVMGRSCAHEMYITHVGDSRVYWISRNNCYQVTQDDDLASREVRLGYALYRSAVQQPSSGSLVQALGMASSSTLHPTVQRFVLDEDCVFLLCSDGLSDNDRVEQFWQTEILPILAGQIDVKTAGERLLNLANRLNGHDNSTIALVHCQVSSPKETGQTQLSRALLQSLPTTAKTGMKTQQIPSARSGGSPWGLLLLIFFLLGLGSVLAYVLSEDVSIAVNGLLGKVASNSGSSPEPTPASLPKPTGTETSSSEITSLNEQAVIKVERGTIKNPEGKDVPLVIRGGFPPQDQKVVGIVSAGTVLKVISKSPDGQWVQFVVCSPGAIASSPQQPKPANTPPESPKGKVTKPGTVAKSKQTTTPNFVKQGDGGWIKEADILAIAQAAQISECTPPTPPASPSSPATPKSSP
ncbi:MAG: protein phosphatase 2C domain-containing protein [Potamolinea sp.]